MGTVYDEIKKKFILEKAYDDWAEYRAYLTDTVIGLGKDAPSKTVCVIGAGPCNDIDLHKLCGAFKQVTLLDCDAASMGFALKRLNNPEIWKMYLVERSLTGIKEKDISDFCDKVLSDLRDMGSRLNADTFEKVICSNVESLRKRMISSEGDLVNTIPKSDIVVCNGVFSQLFSTILFFIRSCAGSLPDRMIPAAMKTADKADLIFKELSKELVPIITRAIIRSAKDFAVFGNEYSENSPVEGACRCIEAVRDAGVISETKAIWDFNPKENVKYEMLLQVVRGRVYRFCRHVTDV
ncbi:MAG: hypothetical protein IKW90_10580 [Lachnospiraceae bacterium]|nr:hypothetical protein [Lachnospiraceae bacterium]